MGEVDTIKKEDIEKMKNKDVLEMLLSEIGESLPELRLILIDERDQYLAHKIRTAPGKRIVAVVGAGHVPGIQKCWNEPVDISALNEIPPKGRLFSMLKWGIPAIVIGLIGLGFFTAGTSAGAHMIKWWVLANADDQMVGSGQCSPFRSRRCPGTGSPSYDSLCHSCRTSDISQSNDRGRLGGRAGGSDSGKT
jgi:pheromone shutdown protein TraB